MRRSATVAFADQSRPNGRLCAAKTTECRTPEPRGPVKPRERERATRASGLGLYGEHGSGMRALVLSEIGDCISCPCNAVTLCVTMPVTSVIARERSDEAIQTRRLRRLSVRTASRLRSPTMAIDGAELGSQTRDCVSHPCSALTQHRRRPHRPVAVKRVRTRSSAALRSLRDDDASPMRRSATVAFADQSRPNGRLCAAKTTECRTPEPRGSVKPRERERATRVSGLGLYGEHGSGMRA